MSAVELRRNQEQNKYEPSLEIYFDKFGVPKRSELEPDYAKPAAPKPFSLQLADKWTSHDRGIYVSYKPPGYPVGMDIYYYGTYSSEDPSQKTVMWERVRNSWATSFASRLKRGVSISEMQAASVDGVGALYFEAPTPRPGVMWRQWAFVKKGHAFVIVSTLPINDAKLLADVESMVKSFRVIS